MSSPDLYENGYRDAMNGEEPFCDLNDIYMKGYAAGEWDYYDTTTPYSHPGADGGNLEGRVRAD